MAYRGLCKISPFSYLVPPTPLYRSSWLSHPYRCSFWPLNLSVGLVLWDFVECFPPSRMAGRVTPPTQILMTNSPPTSSCRSLLKTGLEEPYSDSTILASPWLPFLIPSSALFLAVALITFWHTTWFISFFRCLLPISPNPHNVRPWNAQACSSALDTLYLLNE